MLALCIPPSTPGALRPFCCHVEQPPRSDGRLKDTLPAFYYGSAPSSFFWAELSWTELTPPSPPPGAADAERRGFFLDPYPLGSPLDDFDHTVHGEGTINFTGYGIDHEGSQRERRADDPNVEILPPPSFLSPDELMELEAEVLIDYSQGLRDDDELGRLPYLRTLEKVQELLLQRGEDWN